MNIGELNVAQRGLSRHVSTFGNPNSYGRFCSNKTTDRVTWEIAKKQKEESMVPNSFAQKRHDIGNGFRRGPKFSAAATQMLQGNGVQALNTSGEKPPSAQLGMSFRVKHGHVRPYYVEDGKVIKVILVNTRIGY